MPRVILLLAVWLLSWPPEMCQAGGSSLGFSIHHRFSDPVRSIFPDGESESLPEKGTVEYYSAMAERDRIHGRRLATGNYYETPLTFVAGNTTYSYPSFGFLYYANVTIGTPGMNFLVALDTGSDLFWLPCDCISCVTSVQTVSGEMKFNVYTSNASSTSKQVPCSSPLCPRVESCVEPNECPYEIAYMSVNTSSSGYLVEDEMHLTTDSVPSQVVDTIITFGCGQNQTGSLLRGGAPNGLLGLGLDQISIPSTLARENVTANSFSMCFAQDEIGRISFGDKGSSDQAETPFVFQQFLTYFVGITQVAVGKNVSKMEVDVLFDTGTSFTLLADPIYTFVTKAFDSLTNNKRYTGNARLPFEFCYEMSEINAPSINLTMKGGSTFNVMDPLLLVIIDDVSCLYCLEIMKEDRFNIIGENFMSGYRIVFDRERLVLGWKESNCDYAFETKPKTLPKSSVNGLENSGATIRFKHWALAHILLVAIFWMS